MKSFGRLLFLLASHVSILAFFSLVLLLLSTPAVVHAQWEPNQRLTFNDSISLTSRNNAHCIAASGDTVHVIWWDCRDGDWEIYYCSSTDGGVSWSTDRRLSQAPSASRDPSIAVDCSTVHVAWYSYQSGDRLIRYRRSTNSGRDWEPERHLSDDSSSSREPSLSVAGAAVHLVWWDHRDGNYEVYYKRSTDGGVTWGADTRLTYDTAASCQDLPRLRTGYRRFSHPNLCQDTRRAGYQNTDKCGSPSSSKWTNIAFQRHKS
jgi:hypothetical protein